MNNTYIFIFTALVIYALPIPIMLLTGYAGYEMIFGLWVTAIAVMFVGVIWK